MNRWSARAYTNQFMPTQQFAHSHSHLLVLFVTLFLSRSRNRSLFRTISPQSIQQSRRLLHLALQGLLVFPPLPHSIVQVLKIPRYAAQLILLGQHL